MKKIMDFIFGKKYPIFNKQGHIQHKREDFLNLWKERYIKNPNKNWKNHSGMYFKSKPDQ